MNEIVSSRVSRHGFTPSEYLKSDISNNRAHTQNIVMTLGNLIWKASQNKMHQVILGMPKNQTMRKMTY